MKRLITFLKQTWAELGKVVWPTRRRTLKLTATVIVVSGLFAAFIGAVDYGLTKGLEAVVDSSQNAQENTDSIQVPAGDGQQPIQIPIGGNQPGGQ